MSDKSGQSDRYHASEALSDTLRRCLTPEERERLSMDSWEPSLLRKLLQAQGKIARKTGD